jgi:hypothetical protein
MFFFSSKCDGPILVANLKNLEDDGIYSNLFL